jgi:predicted GIY-YIG superfamily endonuclease
MHVIYHLYDPRDRLTFYVGETEDVYQRFLDHIQCRGSNFAKNAKILEMRQANVLVQMEELERIEDSGHARIREAYWIRHYETLGHPLTNVVRPERELKAKVLVRSTQATKKLIENQFLSQMKKATGGFPPERSERDTLAFRLAEHEVAPFIAAYKASGSINKALKAVGHGARYHPHAVQILDQAGLRQREEEIR